jgi:hypothetical protein
MENKNYFHETIKHTLTTFQFRIKLNYIQLLHRIIIILTVKAYIYHVHETFPASRISYRLNVFENKLLR